MSQHANQSHASSGTVLSSISAGLHCSMKLMLCFSSDHFPVTFAMAQRLLLNPLFGCLSFGGRDGVWWKHAPILRNVSLDFQCAADVMTLSGVSCLH